MENTRIQDIPKIKKLLGDVKTIKSLKAAMPVLGPVLRLFGVNVSQMRKALANIEEFECMAEELASVPDHFNDLFSERGWIIYDLMNMEVAKAAINKAEAGDIDGAETDLVAYYDAETVKWKLQTMVGVKVFRPRMELAQKALIDYREERYHACVPVVLALLDGLVNELHEKRRGFSAEEVDLQAWDSIAAHSKGLNVLTRIFQTGRYTTRTEQITIPYRNGIMHGMDLGYDNRMVAAKTWAALFATRDWALKVQQGELTAPPEQSKPTLSDVLRQIQEYADDKAKLDSWVPRNIVPGRDIPASGKPEEFEEGTPERRLVEFLSYWKLRNYGYMAQYLPYLDKKYYQKRLPSKVNAHYKSKLLDSYELLEILADGVNVAIIKVRVVYEEGSKIECIQDFNLMYEDEVGKPSVRGKAGHNWVIYNSYV